MASDKLEVKTKKEAADIINDKLHEAISLMDSMCNKETIDVNAPHIEQDNCCKNRTLLSSMRLNVAKIHDTLTEDPICLLEPNSDFYKYLGDTINNMDSLFEENCADYSDLERVTLILGEIQTILEPISETELIDFGYEID